MFGGETVVVLTGATVAGPYSDATTRIDWTTPAETPVAGVLCEPRPSSEPVQDARNAVTSGFTLYLPAGTVVDSTQRVRVRGVDYEVLGDAQDWRLGGWRPGLVLQVERVTG